MRFAVTGASFRIRYEKSASHSGFLDLTSSKFFRPLLQRELPWLGVRTIAVALEVDKSCIEVPK